MTIIPVRMLLFAYIHFDIDIVPRIEGDPRRYVITQIVVGGLAGRARVEGHWLDDVGFVKQELNVELNSLKEFDDKVRYISNQIRV